MSKRLLVRSIYILFLSVSIFAVDRIEDFSRFKNLKEVHSSGKGIDEWMIKMNSHPVNQTGYEIITDHSTDNYIEILSKLANFHRGTVRRVNNFKDFKTKARFVAIAPKKLTEKTVFQCWESLRNLDRDSKLDAYVSFLYASNHRDLDALVGRSINYQRITKPQVVGMGTFVDKGYRSYGKLNLLHNTYGKSFSSIVSTDKKIKPIDNQTIAHWHRPQPMVSIPNRDSIDECDVLFVFGHGKPDWLCGYKVSAFSVLNLNNKLVMSGSCYSGINFSTVCINRGAIAVYSHLYLNRGFSRLYPCYENLVKGKSIGQVQQELINTNFDFISNKEKDSRRRHLLYVIIGDPALRIFH